MAETSLYEYCGQIDSLIEQGRFAEAAAHGKHILKQYPKYVEAYRLLGKAMLEAGQDEYAVDMFRRVLSADPEDLVAWVGLSEVHNKNDELDAAVWYLERAFELTPDNRAIEEELRHLYGRRDGAEPQKVPLTPGALARLYLKGNLLSRAINDLNTLLADQPDRMDLRVTLAEALWRNDQRLEATSTCQQILDELPYCLKANLILGSIWVNSGRDEGQDYLRRAEALDPESRLAQELFGDDSPLTAREIQIVPLEYRPVGEEERPAWMAEVEGVSAQPPLSEEEASLVDLTAALEAQIEIPSWLEEIATEGEEAAAPLTSAPLEPPEMQLAEQAPPAPAEEIPAWLIEGVPGEAEVEQQKEATVAGEEKPEWPAGLKEETLPVPGQAPEWLSGLTAEGGGEEAAPAVPTAEQPPDWLSGLREQFVEEPPAPEATPLPEEPPSAEISGAEEPAAAMPAPAEIPDWLQELAPAEAQPAPAPAVEEAAPVEPPAPAEIPDWLQKTGPVEAQPPPEPAAEEAAPVETPTWLEGEGVPSGDEALAWLEQLAAGKEEKLQAQIKVESEARMAEIMGRPAPAEPAPAAPAPPPEPAAEEATPVETPTWLEGEGVPSGDEALAWLEQLAVGKEEELQAQIKVESEARMAEIMGRPAPAEPAPAPPAAPAPAVEEAAPVETPAWLEGEGVPSGDEALAWLEQLAAGKEEELQAQIKVESEARMAEIMGRPAPAEPAPAPPPVPAAPAPAEEPVPAEIPAWIQALAPSDKAPPPAAEEEAPAPPSEELMGWTAFGELETAPQAAQAPLPAAEEEVTAFETPPEQAPAPPSEELMGWTAFGELETAPEAAPAVEATPPPEQVAVPQKAAHIEEIHWEEVQAALEAEEEPGAAEQATPQLEEPPLPEEVAAPREIAPVGEAGWEKVRAVVEQVVPTPQVEEAPPVVESEVPPPPPEPEAAPAMELPPEPVAPPQAPAAGPFAAERAYLKENPRDYQAWLTLGRSLWQANEQDSALEAYSRVIRSSKLLESVIPDLEGYLEQRPNIHVQRTLGDAYMKDGRLKEALNLYRHALETLS